VPGRKERERETNNDKNQAEAPNTTKTAVLKKGYGWILYHVRNVPKSTIPSKK
jgi:hypothetical protein